MSEPMTKVAKIFLAEGFEETEAIVPYDILRRGGVDVKFVSVTQSINVRGTHGVSVEAQETISASAASADLLVLPGGMPGTLNLASCQALNDILSEAASKGKLVAAICAAPSILGHIGLLKGRRATCYPGFEDKLAGANCTGERIVKDGNFITGIGPGASYEFGLALLTELEGEDVAREVKSQMIMK